MLVWLALALVPAFAVTTAVTQSYRAEQRRLAADWFARGQSALRAGRAADAIASFHNALTFSRENQLFRLHLAQALAAHGRTSEARAYLLTLWDVQPGNGEVNLALARLAAQDGTVESAQRYYRHAIEAAWSDAAEARRREVRLELASFLVDRRRMTDARAELIALQGDLPEDTALRRRVARLMVDAGLLAQAAAVYQAILQDNPADAAALAGAGRAAFEQADYPRAVRLLTAALKADGGEQVEPMLTTARLVLTTDPYQRRLPIATRTERAQTALNAAHVRLAQCSAAQNHASLQELSADLRSLGAGSARVARSLESIDAAMDLVFRIEQTTAAVCGEPDQPLDRALLLLGQQTRGVP